MGNTSEALTMVNIALCLSISKDLKFLHHSNVHHKVCIPNLTAFISFTLMFLGLIPRFTQNQLCDKNHRCPYWSLSISSKEQSWSNSSTWSYHWVRLWNHEITQKIRLVTSLHSLSGKLLSAIIWNRIMQFVSVSEFVV